MPYWNCDILRLEIPGLILCLQGIPVSGGPREQLDQQRLVLIILWPQASQSDYLKARQYQGILQSALKDLGNVL